MRLSHGARWLLLLLTGSIAGSLEMRAHYQELESPAPGNERITANFWQTARSLPMPKSAVGYREQWRRALSPGWAMHLHDDSQVQALFRELGIARQMSNVSLGVMRGDMWRYAVMYLHGGLYADVDTYPVPGVPVRRWLSDGSSTELVVAMEHEAHFCQWTFAARPGASRRTA